MDAVDDELKFKVGSVLSRTWRTMWKKPFAFMGLTFASEIAAAILLAAVIFLGGSSFRALSKTGSSSSEIVASVIGGAVYVMTMMLFQGTLTYMIFQLFMRDTASVWESLTRSLSKVLTVFLATVAAVVGGGIVCLGTGFILSRMLGPVGGLLGFFTAIFLGYFFFTTWFVFAPACVVERLGALSSLDRSGKLTKGHRLKIGGVFVLLVVVSTIFNVIANKLIPESGIITIIVKILIVLVPKTFASLVPAVVYYSLRVVKENLTPESLADIFD
jgi:hypothetical protein